MRLGSLRRLLKRRHLPQLVLRSDPEVVVRSPADPEVVVLIAVLAGDHLGDWLTD